jgi:hypothetical protein
MPSPKQATFPELSAALKSTLPTRKSFKNLTGARYTRLMVLGYLGVIEESATWVCICECPAHTLVKVRGHNLFKGLTKSCGCISKEPRAERSPILENGQYRPWKLKKLPPFTDHNEYYKRSTGYVDSQPGFFYIQEVKNKTHKFLKVGICNDWPERRCSRIDARSKFNHALTHWWSFKDGRIPKRLESRLKQELKGVRAAKRKFDGYTETAVEQDLEYILRQVTIEELHAQGMAVNHLDYYRDRPQEKSKEPSE